LILKHKFALPAQVVGHNFASMNARTYKILSFAVSTLFLASCATAPQSRQPVQLFNGRDLQGWKFFLADPSAKMSDVWSVQDGILICKGEPMGYIYTGSSFKNFKLLVEYRWAPGQKPGNSGIFLRIHGQPQALPRTIEHQLKDGDAGDLYGFHGRKVSGDPTRAVFVPQHKLGGDIHGLKKLAGNEKPPGEWNRVEIEVRNARITAMLNGRLVNEGLDEEPQAGPIGLQSEGGEIHFRTVELTPLP